ncbi:uncharacterized protein SETTUDRAFT_36616 [Exserohilum turcica Et28A]|uniref:Uncharacterized protein n=1 Tax=Exserohilum turcicum (strain 28A) TaxID=671987 RepID=R0J350_EXST2|nr:uncharacterized protein SETTUDRAFT_36616 [Exserohilum turcica Et28A]EOA91136.1 hypothetical protein SETTUDRAFT_36616 [Exserohilum turcica Et28A]
MVFGLAQWGHGHPLDEKRTRCYYNVKDVGLETASSDTPIFSEKSPLTITPRPTGVVMERAIRGEIGGENDLYFVPSKSSLERDGNVANRILDYIGCSQYFEPGSVVHTRRPRFDRVKRWLVNHNFKLPYPSPSD